jgi:hypothetical protein
MTVLDILGHARYGVLAGRASRAEHPLSPRTGALDRHEAWLKAMEQANLRSWFQHPSDPRPSPSGHVEPRSASSAGLAAGAPPAPRSPLALRPAPIVWSPSSAGLSFQRAGSAWGSQPHGPERQELPAPPLSAGPCEPCDPPVWGLRARVADAADRCESAADISTSSGAPSGGAATPTPLDPVRVHAEWSDDGVRIWLGVDADAGALSARVESLSRELRRRLDASGARLLRIVFNGRVVWEERAASQPSPEARALALAPSSDLERPIRHASLTPLHHPQENP